MQSGSSPDYENVYEKHKSQSPANKWNPRTCSKPKKKKIMGKNQSTMKSGPSPDYENVYEKHKSQSPANKWNPRTCSKPKKKNNGEKPVHYEIRSQSGLWKGPISNSSHGHQRPIKTTCMFKTKNINGEIPVHNVVRWISGLWVQDKQKCSRSQDHNQQCICAKFMRHDVVCTEHSVHICDPLRHQVPLQSSDSVDALYYGNVQIPILCRMICNFEQLSSMTVQCAKRAYEHTNQ